MQPRGISWGQLSRAQALQPEPPGSRRDTRRAGAKDRGPLARHENRRALEPAFAQIGQSLVRSREGIAHRRGRHAGLGRDGEEIDRVLAREVRDRYDLPFLPEIPVREARDVAHVDPSADHPPALANVAERDRDQRSDRRKQDRGIERHRRALVGAAGPDGAELRRKGLRLAIARARKGVDLAALPATHLRDDVRRGAETVDSDPFPVARRDERAPADQARTHERRRGDRVVVAYQLEDIGRVRNGELRKAAVARVAREQRIVAEVLVTRGAVGALPAGVAEPGNADALARREPLRPSPERIDDAHDLVAGDQRQFRMLEVALHDVEVRAAHRAGLDPHADFAGPGFRRRNLLQAERLADPSQHHGLHERRSKSVAALPWFFAPAHPILWSRRRLQAAAPACRPRGGFSTMPGFLLRVLIVAVGLWLASAIVPGIAVRGAATLLGAALLLGIVNAVVRPVVVVLTLPITILTLGLFLLVVNAA